ncbi:MAG: TonB family protein [Planctomycetota bacterium]
MGILLVPVAIEAPAPPTVIPLHVRLDESALPDLPADETQPLEEQVLEPVPEPAMQASPPWEPDVEEHEEEPELPEETAALPKPVPDLPTPSLDAPASVLARRPRSVASVTPSPPPPAPTDVAPALQPPPPVLRPARVQRPRPTPPRAVPRQAWVPSPTSYYPEPARLEGVEGAVRLELDIAASGSVLRAWVIASSGDARLDEAAVRLGMAIRFHPMAGPAAATFTVRFRLES